MVTTRSASRGSVSPSKAPAPRNANTTSSTPIYAPHISSLRPVNIRATNASSDDSTSSIRQQAMAPNASLIPRLQAASTETSPGLGTTLTSPTSSTSSTSMTNGIGPNVRAVPFTHTPSPFLLGWLVISLPLVCWDTAYMLGRPHTMPGGRWHQPLWSPYALYGQVDRVYGPEAWDSGLAFAGAQSFMNLVESALYVWYLWSFVVGAKADQRVGRGMEIRKCLTGKAAARAVLVCFAAAVMTFSKTMLYWVCEYYAAFDNIGHNDWLSLIFLWIIPNGAWLVGPGLIIYSLGSEIVANLVDQGTKRVKV